MFLTKIEKYYFTYILNKNIERCKLLKDDVNQKNLSFRHTLNNDTLIIIIWIQIVADLKNFEGRG